MAVNRKWRESNRKQVVILILAILIVVWGVFTYNAKMTGSLREMASFVRSDGSSTMTFEVEVARTPAERAKGLMYRKDADLANNQGMLFVFPGEDRQSFWMKNTYVSLDMIFIDKSYKVVGIIEQTPVLNESPQVVDAKSQYVVELKAGTSKRERISVGDMLRVKSS